MATQESLWPVYQIQQADARLAAVERTRASLDDGTALGREVMARRSTVAAQQEAVRQAEKSVRDAEMDLSSVEAHMKRIKGILYGGKVNNPKELQQYEKEFESLGRRKSALEDAVLERMDATDAARSALSTDQQEEAAATAQYRAHVKAYRERLAALDAETKDLTERRDACRAQADPDLLREYDLAVRRRKLLVGFVEQDSCSACAMLLPGRMIKMYRTYPDSELVCPTPTCGAHLLWRVPAE